RQCVVSLWTPHDLVMSAMKSKQRPKDIPCTLTWKFYARNGKLNMCVDMRSNDLVLGMPYDIFAFTCIQRLIANELGVDVGDYVHTVGSLHLYEKHYELGKEAYLASSTAMREQHGWSNHDKLEHVETALY